MEKKWKKGRLGFFVILCSMVLSFCFGFSSLAAREKEDNGSFERANQITVGTTVTGSISSRGDEDFFKFTIKKKGKIRFQIKDYDLGFLEVSMCLYDQNKRNIFEGGTANSIMEKSISVSPGVYYLRVIQWGMIDQGAFPYSFKINFSEGKGNCQEQENFASFQRAKKISIGSGVYGTISRQGGCAYYKFTLPQDGVVYFTGARTVSGDDFEYWQTSLYNAKKQKIDSFYYNSHYGRRRVGLSAGTYYIKIMRASKRSKNRYYFKLDYKRSDKWEKELNDTPDKSTRIRLNSYVYGSENSLNDIDYYNFTMSKNGKIKFDFRGEDECYAVLYDSSHKQVNAKTLHYTEGLADSLSSRAPISLKKGKYYLKICHNYLAWADHNRGDYYFRVRTVAEPASIKLNKTSVTLTLPNTKTVQLKATVTGASKKVTWKSSNSRVASVSSTGKVTAKSAGKAVISATANGKTAKCTVTVKNVSSSSKKAQHKKYVSYIKAFHNKNFNAYMEWVYEGLVQPGDSDPITYFAFMDIDGDGTDECMVRFCFQGGSMTTAPGGARSELYTIRSGKVKKVVEQGRYGSGSYPQIGVYRGSRLVEFVTSGHMDDRNEFFTFNNGALGRKAAYSYEWIAGYGTGNYYVNGTKTTKAKYNAFANKMKKGKRGYTMYRYTTANLNKFL